MSKRSRRSRGERRLFTLMVHTLTWFFINSSNISAASGWVRAMEANTSKAASSTAPWKWWWQIAPSILIVDEDAWVPAAGASACTTATATNILTKWVVESEREGEWECSAYGLRCSRSCWRGRGWYRCIQRFCKIQGTTCRTWPCSWRPRQPLRLLVVEANVNYPWRNVKFLPFAWQILMSKSYAAAKEESNEIIAFTWFNASSFFSCCWRHSARYNNHLGFVGFAFIIQIKSIRNWESGGGEGEREGDEIYLVQVVVKGDGWVEVLSFVVKGGKKSNWFGFLRK